MPKLTETYAKKLLALFGGHAEVLGQRDQGPGALRREEVEDLVFPEGCRRPDPRILIGRYPVISAQAARTTALELALEMGRGAGKVAQIGAPTLANRDGGLPRPAEAAF